MYDLRVPVESYEREVERLKSAAANAVKDSSQGTKGKKEQERFNTLIDKLQVQSSMHLLLIYLDNKFHKTNTYVFILYFVV